MNSNGSMKSMNEAPQLKPLALPQLVDHSSTGPVVAPTRGSVATNTHERASVATSVGVERGSMVWRPSTLSPAWEPNGKMRASSGSVLSRQSVADNGSNGLAAPNSLNGGPKPPEGQMQTLELAMRKQ